MRAGAPQRRHQQAGHQEVAEVIRAELQLEAVGGLGERTRHDPGVVDQQIEVRVARRGSARRTRGCCASEPSSSASTPTARVAGRRANRRGDRLALGTSRAVRITSAPRDARARAVSWPSPLEPPVTSATLPLRSMPSTTSSRSCRARTSTHRACSILGGTADTSSDPDPAIDTVAAIKSVDHSPPIQSATIRPSASRTGSPR